MYHKAVLINDHAIAQNVLAAGHPREVTSLGRKVKNFSEEKWASNRNHIVKQGNVLKFTTAVTEEGFRTGTSASAPSWQQLTRYVDCDR